MQVRNIPLHILKAIVVLAVVGFSLGTWAQEAQGAGVMDDGIEVLIFDDDQAMLPVLDDTGTLVAQGMLLGELRCSRANTKCIGTLELRLGYLDPLVSEARIEYTFETLEERDPEVRRMVVAGEGVMFIPEEDFSDFITFSGLFGDNGDGTISVFYNASNPSASLRVLNAPGTWETRPR